MKNVTYNMTVNEAVDPQLMLKIYHIKRYKKLIARRTRIGDISNNN